MKSVFLCATATVALLAVPNLAMAQEAVPVADSSSSEDESEAIVVTGSRLSSSALTSTAPVTVVGAAQIEQSGLENIADVVTDLPSVGVGLTDSNSQNDGTRVGLNLVDLRNLGVQRTLVLVNGRRQVAGDPLSSAVDLNTIPSQLVDRVEVVTGGTSAVYGADAVSGVLNVILKKNFEGLEARASGGITSRGDGTQFGLSLTGGHNFDESRGNVTVNLFYDDVKGVGAIDRGYASNGLNLINNPANVAANDGIPNRIHRRNIRFYDANQLGFIDLGPFGVFVPSPTTPGGIRPFNFGDPAFGSANETDFRQVGGDAGFFEQYDNLSLPQRRYGISASLNYELADNINLFAEARYINTRVRSSWQPVADSFQYFADEDLTFISTENPFFPAALLPAFQAVGAPGFLFFRVYDDFGRRSSDAERQQHQYTVGIEGNIFGDFKYNIYGLYGRNSQTTRLLNGRDQDRYLESVDVITLNGAPACRSAAARARGCVPFNPLNPSSTPGGIAYSRFDDNYFARQTLKNAVATISGDLFELPAGPVATAIGVEYRETTINTFPSSALQRGRTYYPQEVPVSGNIKSSEAFGELRVPILSDIPFIEELTLQAAGRVADYNTTGTDYTWNLGGTYSPIDGVRFRAMRSRSVRAPNVAELFSPQQQVFDFLTDPCGTARRNDNATRAANCTALGIPAVFAANDGATRAGLLGGNPNLNPEVAKTWTAGVVLTPLPGLSATIDFYDIKITGAIDSLSFQELANNCVDQAVPVATNLNCIAVTRDPGTFQITNIQATTFNLGRITTRGIDFAVNYGFDLEGAIGLPGRLSLSLNGTYLDRLRRVSDANNPQAVEQLENRLGKPQWDLLGSATYSNGPVAVTWRAHYLESTFIEPSTNIANPPPSDQYDLPNTGTEIFHDLSVSVDVTERANLRVNVNNIFDNKPPARGNRIHQGAGAASIYPNLGTNFNAAMTFKF